jgi:hypothetical protein
VTRQIVQIAFEVEGDDGSTSSILHALCDDGTIWYLVWKERELAWVRYQLPPIPEDD